MLEQKQLQRMEFVELMNYQLVKAATANGCRCLNVPVRRMSYVKLFETPRVSLGLKVLHN